MRRIATLVVSLVLTLASFGSAVAAPAKPPADWDLPGGHFYTQASGFPAGSTPVGYAIVDDKGGRFWSEFQRLGGIERLGYPASRRFQWQGFLTQATQKALLQWRPETGKVALVNVIDDLGAAGLDPWLLARWSVPGRLPADFDAGKPWADVVAARTGLLQARPALAKRYAEAADPMNLYGLPTSQVTDMGNHYSVRLQRAVLQEWKLDMPWAKAGEVTVANGGDVFKEAGLGPPVAFRPEMPAPQALARVWTFEPGVYTIDARGTWYGGEFHGRKMANGQIYDMNDPTTTACNIYPLGAKLRVTAKKTGKSIEVIVKDTGGFRYPLVVDLSLAAFRALGLREQEGSTDVRVEWIGN